MSQIPDFQNRDDLIQLQVRLAELSTDFLSIPVAEIRKRAIIVEMIASVQEAIELLK